MKRNYLLPHVSKGWYSALVWLLLAVLTITNFAPAPILLAAPGDVTITKTAVPDPVSGIGGTTEVKIKVTGEPCSTVATGADVVVIIDHSGSMYGQPLADAKAAATTFVGLLNPAKDQVAIVQFDDTVQLLQTLTTDITKAKTVISQITDGGLTNIGDAITTAQTELTSARAKAASAKVIILLTDGQYNTGPDPVGEATKAKTAGSTIFAIF